MGLREQLMDDLKDALRQKNDRRKIAIRSVIAAIQQEETNLDASGQRIHLEDNDILVVINKQVKMREESIFEYRRGRREDLVAEEEAELEVLQSYLPRQLTREEIEAQARQIIDEVGASGPSDLGRVMKPLMSKFRGRIDGRLANEIVRELLSA